VRATLRPGLTARLEYVVPGERTVSNLLPEAEQFADLPPVLATGYMVGIVEWTCQRAIDGHLSGGEQTLGVHVDLSHEAPTPVGGTLTVEVELTAVERRRLTFAVHAFDEAATVCRGTHQRAVIDRARFMEKLDARGRPQPPETAGRM
jgi:fluoroacetyl-CoA thioesterase